MMARARIDRHTPRLLDPPVEREAAIASVALLRPVDKLYSYRVPDELAGALAPGMRVSVPVGRHDKPAVAMCIEIGGVPLRTTLKSIIDVIDPAPILSAPLLELGHRIARYYCAPLGRTLDLMVPAGAKRRAGWKIRRFVRPTAGVDAPAKLSARQARVLEVLRAGAADAMAVEELAVKSGSTAAVIQGLRKRGIIQIESRRVPPPAPLLSAPRHEPDYELNQDQSAAVAAINAAIDESTFGVHVLFGVTGSGKTEVYIAAIRRALAAGRQAILLVPEIALTTQTVNRLAARFDRVLALHSALSDAERSVAWAAIGRGEVDLVIGTRSAVFAPCPRLGLIVVDEEHEGSYKNLAAPRFHTRDVAILRGQLQNIPVVLGSATPSLETWHNLQNRKHYRLLRLPNRVRNLPMPRIELVDMRDEHRDRPGIHMLSRKMEACLEEALDHGEQAVLLLNRRGYASFLHCPKCRTVVTCRHCSVNMVFHRATEQAHCHYCHARLLVPRICGQSGCDGRLVKFGIGVERVEEEIRERFPQARVRRVDSDAMQSAGDYAEVLTAFERREFNVLVGTQMIAKGLDFPFVSFVGVISADTALALGSMDFRSEERTFQLVLQVAGRGGRGDIPGTVVVQTFSKESDSIRHAVAQNYEAFARRELDHRRRHRLPPLFRMVRIVLEDRRSARVEEEAGRVAESVSQAMKRRGIAFELFGPQPAPLARVRDRHRHDFTLSFPRTQDVLDAMDLFKAEHLLRASVESVIVDVDPVSLQ